MLKKKKKKKLLGSLKLKKARLFLGDELQINNLVRFISHLMLSPLFVPYKGHVIRSCGGITLNDSLSLTQTANCY